MSHPIILPPIIADAALAYGHARDALDTLILADVPADVLDAAADDLHARCDEIVTALVAEVERHTYPTA